MRNAGLEETQAGVKIAGRNLNNLRYADDTTLMAESEEELKSLLMKVKVEVKNRFKGLDLIDRVPDELWTEIHDIVQETGIKTIPKIKKLKKQNGCLRGPYK